MLPSDHFVRFYNEVFKFLECKGGLEDYYRAISRHQELHCLRLFWGKGLAGMEEYWHKITLEENCQKEHGITPEGIRWSWMQVCPSLSKVLDNDAAPCASYCEHCPGWVMPLLSKCGFYCIYDIIDPHLPTCKSFITEDRQLAEKVLLEFGDRPEIRHNLADSENIERAAQLRRAGHCPPSD